ncbi:TPA: acetyl-CoA carboxylase, biotin carboxyl carrier protein [Candidatus Poribacteria bacterium]|nr:acetyl-CoA carboxylase, biotin carboxyl carrier protein [Candidatus Poribacteria bacterium]
METLREIVELMEEKDLSEVCFEEGDIKLQVKRGAAAVIPQTPHQLAIPAQIDASGLEIIRATIPGIFYRSPSPDDPAFVEVGDEVRAGDVLCIIEAMKLFNPIEAEFDCDIVEILAENSRPVEYDQPLFKVRRKSGHEEDVQ